MTDTTNNKPPIVPVVIASIIVGLLWLANLYFLYPLKPDDRGTFGDMFGAVNAVFSGLAFIGVVYAIFLQRFEIGIAKDEIKHTKEILREQKESLKLQNQETKKGIFENTFFSTFANADRYY